MLDFIILYSLHALYMWLSLILWLTVVHVTEMFWLLDSIVPWIYSLLLYKHDDTFKQLFRVRLLGHFWLILKMISIVKCALLERKACCYVANAFLWRLELILHPCPIHPNWVDSPEALYDLTRFARYVSTRFAQSRVSQINFRHDESTTGETIGFDRIESNQQHFQPTLHSPPEVKKCEKTIHEPSSILKHGHKLQSIRTIRVDSIESSQINNIFNPPSKSRSIIFSKGGANWLPHVKLAEGETIRVDLTE